MADILLLNSVMKRKAKIYLKKTAAYKMHQYSTNDLRAVNRTQMLGTTNSGLFRHDKKTQPYFF